MRLAAYCRVSTDKEEQLSSLDNQKEFFSQYARKNSDKLVQIYADEGISGKDMKKREAFQKMLRDAETGMFDCVAVKDVSRFARNTNDFLYGIRTLRSYGVDVRFLSNNQTVLGESEFILTVFAALAQQESENLSKRVIFGKQQNAKKGRVPNTVYGYDKIDTYTLAVNEKESYAVSLMFRWYLEGDGTRRIAMRLNEMGIPTKRGAQWMSKTVRRILQNPIYSGKMTNNKSVTKDFLEGSRRKIPREEWYVHNRPELRIISDEAFHAVQEMMAYRREQYQNENPGSRYSDKHIFSNLIHCGVCGKGFHAKVYQGKSTSVRYRCSARHSGGNALCTNSVSIDEQELLDEIKAYLIRVIEDKQEFARKLYEQTLTGQEQTDVPQLAAVRNEMEKRRIRFREMYAAGMIDMEQLKQEMRRIDKRIQSIDAERKEYEIACQGTADMNGGADQAEALLLGNSYSNADMRSIIDGIVVYPDRSAEIIMK